MVDGKLDLKNLPSVAQAPPHQPDADLIGAAEEDLPFLGQWPWLQGRTLESVLGPEVAGENIPCYKRRSCRVALLMLVALVMLSCCLAFPVIFTALAISRLFGAKSSRCPFYMHLAICNWERLHRGSAGPLPELPISEGNLLWVDPNISASQDAMSEAVDALRHANVQKLHHDLCNFLEAWLPKLGFNGIVELLEALEMIRDGEAEDDQDLDVWGINLDDIHAELVDISEDWKHDLGAYVIARLKLHPELNESQYLISAVEVAGSLKLGGGPLHAITWTEMIAFLRSNGWRSTHGLWNFVLGRVCAAFQDLPGLFVHCIHGLGHGAMASGILLAMDQGQRDAYEKLDLCVQIRQGSAGHLISQRMLDIALGICNDAPNEQLGYVCAGGVYMEYWKSVGKNWKPKYDPGGALPSFQSSTIQKEWSQKDPVAPVSDKAWLFEHICLFADFPATCFRFEPGLGVQELRNSLRDWEDVPIYEPCTQSYWSLKASWTRKHLRGCILGRSFHLYQDYDFWRHGRYSIETKKKKSGLQRLNTLAEWCSMYEPREDGAAPLANKTRTLEMKASEDPLLHSYGNWLACIAGSMASLAFVVEESAIDDTIVKEHCDQILDQRGRDLCVKIGLSRHL